MAKRLRKRRIKRFAEKFCKVKDIESLARLIEVPAHNIVLASMNPKYNVFYIPKANGGKRLIEDPQDQLQDIQDALAFYLGCVYYMMKPAAAYGFIMAAKGEQDTRNIVTNAQKHVGDRYMFNADFKDFFHQIKYKNIKALLTSYPFHFSAQLSKVLANIMTKDKRLPMGAPTSPVLSNLCSMVPDKEMQQLCDHLDIQYTRYADDLTFSAHHKIDDTAKNMIVSIAEKNGLAFNKKKYKHYDISDTKKVTGILVGSGGISVPPAFIAELKEDITRYKYNREINLLTGHSSLWIRKQEEIIEGKMNFVEHVHGYDATETDELYDMYESAQKHVPSQGTIKWFNFGYKIN